LKLELITAEGPATLWMRKGRLIRFPQLTMPLLAALTPGEVEIHHTDEIVSPDPELSPCVWLLHVAALLSSSSSLPAEGGGDCGSGCDAGESGDFLTECHCCVSCKRRRREGMKGRVEGLGAVW